MKRDGGAKEVIIRPIAADEKANTPSFLVVHLHIETMEAMGANIIDTMVEAIKPYLEELTNGTALMGILSNYATECLATASCHIPVSLLKKETILAKRCGTESLRPVNLLLLIHTGLSPITKAL